MTDFPAAESFASPADLRAAYKRAVDTNKTLTEHAALLETELKGTRIVKAGFPEGTPGFQLLADLYDGDLSNVQALAEFAGRYGHTPVAAGGGTGGVDVIERAATAAELREGQGQSVTPPGAGGEIERVANRIRELEAKGGRENLQELISLKNQLQRLTVPRT